MTCDPFETIFCSSDPFCTQGTRRRSANLSCAQVTPKERKILVRWVVQASECRKKRTFLKCWSGRQWWTSDVSGRGWKMVSHGHGTSHPIYTHIPTLKPSYIFFTKLFFLGEPWDQVCLPQPAWSLHEDDLLQALDRESHRRELLLIFGHDHQRWFTMLEVKTTIYCDW